MVEYLVARGWRRLSAHGAQCWRSPSPHDATHYSLVAAYRSAYCRGEDGGMAEIGTAQWCRDEQRELMAHYPPAVHHHVTVLDDEGAEHFAIAMIPSRTYVERMLVLASWMRAEHPDQWEELSISERPSNPDDTAS